MVQKHCENFSTALSCKESSMKTHAFSSATRNLRVRCVPRKGRVFFRRVTNLCLGLTDGPTNERTNGLTDTWTKGQISRWMIITSFGDV